MQASGALRQDKLWKSLADYVTRRPALVLLLTAAVLAWPALQGATLSWSYDAHSSLPARYSASRGMDIVRRHWSVGEISQARVLVVSPCSQPVEEWISTSGQDRLRLAWDGRVVRYPRTDSPPWPS